MKKGIEHRFRRPGHFFSRTAVLLALTLSSPALMSGLRQLKAENHHSQAVIDPHRPAMAGAKAALAERAWFRKPDFKRLIEMHNQYLPELDNWRGLFAGHAGRLARLIVSFPGGETLDEEHLRRIFSREETGHDSLANGDVFAPWTNRWSGFWSNGTPQYHLWDSTCCVNGQWIQPVTLSEKRFVDDCCVEEMLLQRETDIAINVFSRENGITGWVSKHQYGRYEIPHIGYRVNDSTLVWICQVKKPGELPVRSPQWLVFLETVDRSVMPCEYRIYGQPVIVEESFSVVPGQEDRHRGTYYAAKDIAVM